MEKFTNTEAYHKIKKALSDKTVIVTICMLAVSVSVVIGMTLLANRTRTPLPSDQETAATNDTTTAPSEETKPQSSGNSGTSGTTATFALPVTGYLFKDHDATTQVYSNTMGDYRVHLGLDIATEADAAVSAAADGTVEQVWNDALMGTCVAVAHANNTVTIYKNLSKVLPEGIEAGATVTRGQHIGNVGDTALVEMADEPHLHFEMTVGGLSVDPMDYFTNEAKQSLNNNVYEDEASTSASAK